MIAVLTANALLFSRMAESLELPSREVDGPFFLWRGDRGEEEVFLYLIEDGGGDAAYGLARIAARRGARLILWVGECALSPAAAEELGLAIGAVLEPEGLHAADALKAVTNFLPDSARELPLPIPAELFRERVPLAEGEAGVFAASTEEPLRNPWLADDLWQKHRIAAWDVHSAGAAAGCRDAEVPMMALLLVTGFVRQSHEAPLPVVERDLLLEEVARMVLRQEHRQGG